MSNEFLEELLSVSIRYGSTYCDDFNVEVVRTAGGQEYRRLVNDIPMRYFNIGYISLTDDIGAAVLDLYYRVYGRFAGFRAKALDDYSTNGYTGTPTAYDQELLLVSSGVYQLQKKYGTGATGIATGYPTRTIFKPVTGTVLVGITNALTGNFAQTITTHWTVDVTTGRITFSANKTKAITGITTGATTLISFGSAHTFIVGDSVHFSGIVGTTQLNNKRAVITAINTGGDNITIGIDSTAYTAWSSGGTVNTRPQSGETVKGGCEFHIPVRFNTKVEIEMTDSGVRSANSIELVELLNP